jgi:hypothetical protein
MVGGAWILGSLSPSLLLLLFLFLLILLPFLFSFSSSLSLPPPLFHIYMVINLIQEGPTLISYQIPSPWMEMRSSA